MTTNQASENNLPPIKRFITTHDPSTKKAIFSRLLSEDYQVDRLPGGAEFRLGYVTQGHPVKLEHDADLAVYTAYLENAPGLVAAGGTVVRIVDVPPQSVSPMHRTVSLDYGVVLEGDMELVLDSGERRRMGRGDVAVQRSTMHAWRNGSETQWGRMMYVLQECEPVVVEGEALKEDYGSMRGVPPS